MEAVVRISTCPHCGAPIYGQEWQGIGDPPENIFTCMCRFRQTTVYIYPQAPAPAPTVQPSPWVPAENPWWEYPHTSGG